MKENRVAIYIQDVAIGQNEAGESVNIQMEYFNNICEQQGKGMVAMYVDKVVSGRSIVDRIELQKLINDSSNNLFDEVWVLKANQVARNVLDLLEIVKTLGDNGVTFRSITEPYDTATVAGTLMMGMLASFVEFERSFNI